MSCSSPGDPPRPRTPVSFADREIALSLPSASRSTIRRCTKRDDMLKDAEIAMRFAKRVGGNRIEVFRPGMRAQRPTAWRSKSRSPAGLRAARSRSISSRSSAWKIAPIAGFEALLRWDHPRLGRSPAGRFHPASPRRPASSSNSACSSSNARRAKLCLAASARRRSADLRIRQRFVAPVVAPRSAAGT